MSNNLTKLTSVEAVLFMIIITVNRIILNQPQKILSSMGSAAILNVLYVSIIAVIFTLIIIKLFQNFSNCDIVDVSEFVGGKILSVIISIFICIYLILIVAASLRNFSEILYVTYYGQTRIFYILLFFILLCMLTNYFGKSSIIRTNVIITVIMLVSLGITFLSVTGNFVFERIFPILGYGAYNTFFSGLSNILAFNGLFGLYILIPMLSDKNNYKRVSIISIVLTSALIILSTGCLLLSLSGNINNDNISPLYTLIAHNKFGNSFQHPESLFVFSWILSMISYVNIIITLTIYFLKKATMLAAENIFIIPVCIIIFVISLIPKNLLETHNMEDFLYTFLLFPMVFIIFPTILIIGNIKMKRPNKIFKGANNARFL